MHELAITQSILDIAEKVCREHNARHVREVRICLGAYSGVVPACVQDYFDVISAGTIAENARLNIKTLPVIMKCRTCRWQGEIDRMHIMCPACQGTDLKMIQGREFYVESLEVD